MKNVNKISAALGASLVGLALLAGCKSAEDKALEQAKAQAASTNTPQQIQYIDKNGDTVTTTVEPPVAGQPQQISTVTAPPAPGPPPHRTDPVITPLGAGPAGSAMTANSGGAMTATDNGAAMTANNSAMTANSSAMTANGSAMTSNGSAMMAAPPAANQQAGPPPPSLQLTVPAGTELAIRINQSINVKHSHAGEHFSGEVVEPVVSNGAVVIPRGTPVGGRIDEAHRRGHFKGRSILELRLTSMTLNGSVYALDTHDTVRTKKGKGKRSAGFIGGLTGAGMLIGGVATGGVGLAIGAAAGAGTGTLLAGTTGNRDIDIPAESIVHFRLSDQLVVQNP